MARRKIIREVVEGKVVIDHPKGETGTIERLAAVVCPSCQKTFYQVAKRAGIGKTIKCGHCGITLLNQHKKRWEVRIA